MEKERIVEKVRKLLALSTSSNEAEAQAAAAKAQAMLAQYNLELSEVEMEEKRTPYLRQFADVGSARVWKRRLMWVLAQSNFCEVVVTSGSSRVAIIGQVHNIEVVRYLYTYLSAQFERLAEGAYRRNGWGSALSWKDAFYMGAVRGLHQRLREEQQVFAQASNQCRALVVVKDEELSQAVKNLYPNLKVARPKRAMVKSAYEQGVEAGKQVSLHQGVKPPSAARRLLS